MIPKNVALTTRPRFTQFILGSNYHTKRLVMNFFKAFFYIKRATFYQYSSLEIKVSKNCLEHSQTILLLPNYCWILCFTSFCSLNCVHVKEVYLWDVPDPWERVAISEIAWGVSCHGWQKMQRNASPSLFGQGLRWG